MRPSVGMTVGKVVIRPHDPMWRAEFDRVRSELESALPNQILAIEHVGSTSVTGLSAKPIIDILVAVPDLAQSLEWVPILRSLGFEYREMDELPDRHYFPRTVAGLRMHHVSVAQPDSRHYRNTLIFRDALRNDPDLCRRYVELKKRLAHELGRSGFDYVNGKTDFILEVLKDHGGEVGGDYPSRDLGSWRRGT